MSTQSDRFDLELLDETDAWSIEQFTGNWEKLDKALSFDGAKDTNGVSPARGIAVRGPVGISVGGEVGDHDAGLLTFYTPDNVGIGLEEVVLLSDFVADWTDKPAVAAAMRTAARMAQARYVPLIFNRRSITIDTEGTTIDLSGVHVRGLPGGTLVTDYDDTSNHETFTFRSYLHAVAGPWGGGDYTMTPTDGSMTDVTIAQNGTKTGSCVRIRNSDLRITLRRVGIVPTSYGGIRVSADTDMGLGQGYTLLDDVTIEAATTSSSLFGVLVDGGDHVAVRDIMAMPSNTYAATVIKASNVQRLSVDGVRCANSVTSGNGIFLWLGAGITQCTVRRGAIHWRLPFFVAVDGPADLTVEQLVVSGCSTTNGITDDISETLGSPYASPSQEVRPLVLATGTGLRLTMRNVKADNERCRVFFQSVEVAPIYACMVRTEDCSFGAPDDGVVLDKHSGTVRDSSAAGMVAHVTHSMMLSTDLDTHDTDVVVSYTHSPS